MLNIEWTRAARQDLAEIVGFIANDNPLAARKMKVLIMEAVIPAARHPRIFRRGRVDGTHEIPPTSPLSPGLPGAGNSHPGVAGFTYAPTISLILPLQSIMPGSY
ncbi:type II toxin-antitoxin system RelE/ParE family toxin [Serratia marcescens]|uniref:type II toxin-antitoxin system RelE/ParE family toxin n=1 Tax=Serratia TaxID=613 RepID=UPI001E54A06F|nr:type II toxin-antitoxin system RelE/ParE family toxin [Serratia marcescens]MCS1375577.1 type II toxin-antitoxin system RelE/ParE family toxin [Serratia marcescens]MCS3413787.1 type II toxin-antitoxin system RelE/ParE family toxin [Serratia marcescens]